MATNLENRVREHLKAVGAIGKDPSGGWTRLAFSLEEDEAHDYARAVFERDEYGLSTSQDEFGNLIGTTKNSTNKEKPVIIGTHLDTVTRGGNYDGVVGFIVGVETVRELRAIRPNLPKIQLIIFRAEESTRFKKSCLGSRAMFLGLSEEELGLAFAGKDGQLVTLAEAVSRLSGALPELRSRTVDPGRVAAYFETHIEQARVLEEYQKKLGRSQAEVPPSCVGIVTSIRAPHRCKWEITGNNGSTLRLLAACVLAVETNAELCAKCGMDIVATVGRVEGAVKGADKINAVPGTVTLPVTGQALNHAELIQQLATRRGCDARLISNTSESESATTLEVYGVTDHSGGSPMGLDSRRDALAALSEIILYLPDNCLVNPDRIIFYTDVRSSDLKARWIVNNALETEFGHRTSVLRYTESRSGQEPSLQLEKIERTERSTPIEHLDKDLQNRLTKAAKAVDVPFFPLPSGAGHDAMVAASSGIPTSMLFIPSIDGLSHNPDEKSYVSDIVAAIRVQVEALREWPQN